VRSVDRRERVVRALRATIAACGQRIAADELHDWRDEGRR